MPIHIAITRRVLPGREEEFQQGLREFFQSSFSHEGVWGANMVAPLPDSNSREYGILRTFANEGERDAFYNSPAFQAWEERARALTEGQPAYRQLHGLEAWFRTGGTPPPRWKMALVTSVGVYVLSVAVALLIGPLIAHWPFMLRTAVPTVLVVIGLTWVVMPILTRLTKSWLHPRP
jgi:antibiotic biosynthesis monooxygenase (ABM) superfamily enzyme